MSHRTIGKLLGAVVVATLVTGCVVDPYSNDRYHRGSSYNRPYDYAPPPKNHHDHDRDYDHDHDRGDYKLPTIVCASKDGRPNRCRTDFAIKRAELDKRYSGSPCTYGRTWGYDGNEVWVTDGCRGRFVLTPAAGR